MAWRLCENSNNALKKLELLYARNDTFIISLATYTVKRDGKERKKGGKKGLRKGKCLKRIIIIRSRSSANFCIYLKWIMTNRQKAKKPTKPFRKFGFATKSLQSITSHWKDFSDTSNIMPQAGGYLHAVKLHYINRHCQQSKIIVQELCESRGGRPGLSVLTSLLVSVDVKIYCTVLRHWSQLVPNMSHDIWGH